MTKPRRGAALVTTLILVVLLSAATAVAARGARHASRLARNAEASVVARHMTESAVLAARLRIEALLQAAPDSASRLELLDGIESAMHNPMEPPQPFVADTLDDGAFAAAVVNLGSRVNVNTDNPAALIALFRQATDAANAERLAQRIATRVHTLPLDVAARAGALRRQRQDSLAAALLGRGESARGINPFESLDELEAEFGAEAPWLAQLADRLTVDGDGRVLIVARGWQLNQDLTREVQAVYAIEGSELRLLRWRERDR
ncbi:hypothetical protein [Gemmatimonas sp. UBA7669]|uniref:hypothetical protein n=1 Tax=Gemmatimonas sp. UBA7669 TaxID=1946568 RepID=UPI0025C0709B|nr:hypothetical protein [Gemmatimonas sp. UBA7669]